MGLKTKIHSNFGRAGHISIRISAYLVYAMYQSQYSTEALTDCHLIVTLACSFSAL